MKIKIVRYYAWDHQPINSLAWAHNQRQDDKPTSFELSMDELIAIVSEKAVMLLPSGDGFTLYTDEIKWRFRQH
jgi:hypothetical protein